MIKCICKVCKKEFWVKPSLFKKGVGKHCSIKCRSIAQKETYKGKGNSFYGKKHTRKTRKHLSKVHLGKHHIKETKDKIGKAFCGKNNPNWKGGKFLQSKGYVLIYSPKHPYAIDNYVLEHRLIIEKQIGRYLTPKEVTHHLGAKDDNRPHMLMAFINQSTHKRFHKNPDKVKPEETIFDGRKLNRFCIC